MAQDPISYQLLIHLSRDRAIRIGRLGTFRFLEGFYVYTGSARRDPAGRIRHHLKGTDRPHWHIDYLIADPHARVFGTRISTESECTLNQNTNGTIAARGLGSSDCRHRCGSHLKRIDPIEPGETGYLDPAQGWASPRDS